MATKYSNPVLEQPLVLKTEYAQRVFHRGFNRTARSLHAIDVILRIIGEDEQVDEVEDSIDKWISEWVTAIVDEQARLQEIATANGVEQNTAYTNPLETQVEVSSPQVSRLVEVMHLYDALVADIDRLWIHRLVDNKHRRQLIFEWQRRTLRLGNRIVDLEQRAHKAAKSKGKEDEVAASIPAAEKEEGQDDGAEKSGEPEATESEGAEPEAKDDDAAKETVAAGAGHKKPAKAAATAPLAAASSG